MRISRLLAIVLVLQVLLLLTQWLGGGAAIKTARAVDNIPPAPGPDAAAQRLEIIDQLKSTNARLDRIISILGSTNLQPQAAKPDYNSKR